MTILRLQCVSRSGVHPPISGVYDVAGIILPLSPNLSACLLPIMAVVAVVRYFSLRRKLRRILDTILCESVDRKWATVRTMERLSRKEGPRQHTHMRYYAIGRRCLTIS